MEALSRPVMRRSDQKTPAESTPIPSPRSRKKKAVNFQLKSSQEA
eukprot:COSAG01_NODE_68636_length_263_cov_1.207317_1_plen_44_part_10